MFGVPESVLVFAVVMLLLGVALFVGTRFIPKGTRTIVRAFWCPFRWRDVTVEFDEDRFGTGRYLDVKRCTAFTPTSAVTCGKLCRYLRHFPSRHGAIKPDA